MSAHLHPKREDYPLTCLTVFNQVVAYRRLAEPVGPYVFEGRVAGRDLELWTELGRWHEDGRPHHLDLALPCQKTA